MSCLELLLLLFRSELKDFSSWGIDLLVTQLHNKEEEIIHKTLEIIEEVTRNNEMMKKVIERCPNLLAMD